MSCNFKIVYFWALIIEQISDLEKSEQNPLNVSQLSNIASLVVQVWSLKK